MLGPLLGMVGSRFGILGILVVLGIYFGAQWLMRGTPAEYAAEPRGAQGQVAPGSDTAAQFVGFVLDDVQNTWTRQFASQGRNYPRAKLVLFTDQIDSACGFGSAASGPFYCPADSRAYIDLGFYRELSQKFGAPGDFAQAYVIAHEIGHHVQHVLGLTNRVGADRRGAESGSVRLELQADCLAGVWAHSTRSRELLETGDVEEGLRAAAAIGDDRLQRQGTGVVRPETWTHGSSEQRVRWFRRGLDQGTIEACDTFSATTL
jgi:uncharacterized protein